MSAYFLNGDFHGTSRSIERNTELTPVIKQAFI